MKVGKCLTKITDINKLYLEKVINKGDIVVDATMGNGNDTLLLSRLCGESGQVLAFDIQEQALNHTRERLQKAAAPENYTLLLESHSHMSQYARPETVSCIVFNLGYLPSGDHSKATKSNTSITAMEQGLFLLKKGGLLSLCIYSGGDSGFQERDDVLTWLKQLDSHKYLVIRSDYYNRPNNPPIPVLIIKL